ncbi:MAG TPA: MBL fold metallo-hydrolase [Candidatus Bathyarchaeia archaeon]|jgi:beta-lactamase superfamily II metal-dependent hydrolase|nr:MBL fold metallo-hydrolase [Candidatus Bathyarchaeia archaeon]
MALFTRTQGLACRIFKCAQPLLFASAVAATLSLSLFSASPAGSAAATSENGKALQIYFVDVEGGQSTLFVTPEGKSLLIDTGWPDNNGRDADRIVAAAKLAGIKQLDFVLLTHYHMDHAGGITQLAAGIPIRTVIDHGENREPNNDATEQVWENYQKLLSKEKLPRVIAKPGETLPIEELETRVISSDGDVLEKPVNGGVKNEACDPSEKRPADQSENARSLGVLFTFGKLRILDLGDLTSDKEAQLVCPVNKVGQVDIYVVSHHGSVSSNSREFLNSIAPRVAIMDNGAAKGGAPSSWDAIKKSPRIEDLWQLHFANEGGAEHNVADSFIANVRGPDAGNYLKLTAWPDGNFEVFNSRTKQTKRYTAR